MVVAAACGGSDQSVPDDAVAVVDGTPVTKAELDELLARAKTSYTSQKRAFPKAGTAEYQSAADAGRRLPRAARRVRRRGREPQDRGHRQGDRGPDRRRSRSSTSVAVRRSSTSRSRSRATPTSRSATTSRPSVLSEKIYVAVTKDAKVTRRRRHEVLRREQGAVRRSPPETRDVRHILVKTKAQATKIYDELKAGADFAMLAKKYSLDEASKANGGKMTIKQGRDRRRVRDDLVPAPDELDLPPGQDAVRLPRHPAALRRPARQDAHAEGSEAADQGAAPRARRRTTR